MSSTRPEAELLLDCARSYVTDEHRNDLSLLDMDWDYLVHTASKHKIIPLLYRALYLNYAARVPGEVLNQLRDLHRVNAARNLLITQELFQLLDLFKDNEIPVIPFKGPVLAASLYGDLSLRQFDDLDILIRERDVSRAEELLHERGYHTIFKLGWEQHLKRDSLTVDFTLDLHWAVTSIDHSFPLTPERLWEHRQPAFLFGRTIAALAPEETLLILCFNGAKDDWASLSHICDIAKLIAGANALHWTSFIEKTRMWGCERIVLIGLYLASNLLGVALATPVRKAISLDRTVPRLAEQVRNRLFLESNRGKPWEWEGYLHQAQMRERLRERMTYFGFMISSLIAPKEKDGRAVRSARQLIYYSLRPLWRVAKQGFRLVADFDAIGKKF